MSLGNFIRKGLEAEQHQVYLSHSRDEVDYLVTNQDYDLLILDLNLPRMDGVQILRRIRSQNNNLPVLVLTARNKVEDRVTLLDLGADDYLVKPFSFSELSARVRALLRAKLAGSRRAKLKWWASRHQQPRNFRSRNLCRANPAWFLIRLIPVAGTSMSAVTPPEAKLKIPIRKKFSSCLE